MSQLNDAINAAIPNIAGDQNALPEKLLRYYKANGATSNDLQDAEYQFLVAKGAPPGQLNDMWEYALRVLKGYSGALNDMMLRFWEEGGTFGVPPILTLPVAGVPNSTGTVNPGVTTDTASGTLYRAVVTNGGSATNAQIKAGSGGNIVAGTAANQAIVSAGAKVMAALTGLSPSTTYQIKYVHTDAEGDSNQASVNLVTAAWLPSDSPASLVGWYRQGVGVTAPGNLVSQWDDQSGLAHHLLQPTAGLQPVYNGVNTITFDGISHWLSALFAFPTPQQISILLTPVSWTDTDEIFTGASGTYIIILRQRGVSPQVNIYAGGDGVSINLPVGALNALTALFNGGTSKIRVGAPAELASGLGQSGNSGGFTLGAEADGTVQSNIAVREVIIRNVDSPSLRANDHQYLRTLGGV